MRMIAVIGSPSLENTQTTIDDANDRIECILCYFSISHVIQTTIRCLEVMEKSMYELTLLTRSLIRRPL